MGKPAKYIKSSRQVTAELLLQMEERDSYSNLALDAQLKRNALSPQDSAFASALFYGVLERQITLDACIAAHSSQPVKKLSPPVRTSLRIAIYQLLYMDRVPDSAAVNESVELIKKLRQAKASGFVNGVLRSFLRANKTIPLPKSPLSKTLSVEFSCPEPLVKLWLDSYGEVATRRILEDSVSIPPVYIRVNTHLTDADTLIEALSKHGISAARDEHLTDCLVISGTGAPHNVGNTDILGVLPKAKHPHKLPEFAQGLFHIQDKSSQLCALALNASPDMRVLDACSAPGGKTFTLAQHMKNSGEIVACDLHSHRLEPLIRRAGEMQLTNIKTKAADMSVFDESLGLFDRVLCDAPCSGFGVIRRKPEIKYKKLEEIENLPAIQYKILENTSQYCKVGGLLIYSTCTLNSAENEDVVQRFLDAHSEFEPAPLPEILGGKSQRTLISELSADGFFMAAFVRKDSKI